MTHLRIFVWVLLGCFLSQTICTSKDDLIIIPLERKIRSKSGQSVKSLSLASISSQYLMNKKQMMYQGTIKIGSNDESFSVMLDTGSNIMWIPSITCGSNCSSNFSHFLNCTSSSDCNSSKQADQIEYGEGTVSGVIASTLVSINSVESMWMSFLLVDKTEDLSSVESDGLLGLGVYTNSKYGSSPSFITALHNANLIPNPMFSLYLTFNTDDSMLILGGFYQSVIKYQKSMDYFNLIVANNRDDQRWSIQGQSLSFSTFNTTLAKTQVLIDSGSSMILMSKTIFDNFCTSIKNNYSYVTITNTTNQVVLTSSCSASLPDFQVNLVNTYNEIVTFTIPSSFYLYTLNADNCQLLFDFLDVEGVNLILGDVFLRRYLAVFDIGNLQIGLARSTSESPNSSSPDSSASYNKYYIIAGGIVIFAILAAFKYCKKKRYQKKQEDQLKPAYNPYQQQYVEQYQAPNMPPPQQHQFSTMTSPIYLNNMNTSPSINDNNSGKVYTNYA